MDLKKTLGTIDELLRSTMHPLSYMAEGYFDLMKLSANDEGIKKAKKAYQDSLNSLALYEYDYWAIKQRTAHKKLIYAVYAYAKDHLQIPLKKHELEKAMTGSVMDTADRMDRLADKLLNEVLCKQALL